MSRNTDVLEHLGPTLRGWISTWQPTVAASTGVLDVSPRKELSRRRLSCPILDLSAKPGCERGLRPCDTVETKSTAEAASSIHQEAWLRSALGACPRFAAGRAATWLFARDDQGADPRTSVGVRWRCRPWR